ncbi:carbamoyltransferase family protein [Lentzea aerocolonigenes]|uniref:carbamoyltransferase family protein n=1 Tax=Lentzea aerocolonigenes TaxID=68170 RepID=UPI0009DFA4E1|nr:carbamoyltransferase C-terminal domain-containing protein [Lentzea aerocolonigenes]MCP2243371.1 carbamoyltransferase [Lentzea aerocolonigenes]
MKIHNSPAQYVLGVNSGPHDGSAVILRDGLLLAMVEQERLSRNRYALGESPSKAIAACLRHAAIELADVTTIAVGWDVPRLCEVEGTRYDRTAFLHWMLGSLWDGQASLTLRFVEHHLAHAASAFYTSGFPNAAIVVADGRGETVSTSIALGSPSGIEIVNTWGIEASLGHLYGWVADWVGFTHWGAGKLMGLAAYGRANQHVPLIATPDGYLIVGGSPSSAPAKQQFMLSRSRTRAHLRMSNPPFSAGNPCDVMAYADLAASMQQALEESILSLASLARRLTGENRLVMAGGVALNCAANGRLQRSGLFQEVWVPPVPNDAGVSLGAALVVDRETRGAPVTASRLTHAFWAPTMPSLDAQALQQLDSFEIEQHDETSLVEAVARHLADGSVVGWWQGRAEIGQRALGARSILCDPRKREATARVNGLKKREHWRPLAPALPEQDFGRFFDGDPSGLADFMLAAWPVRAAVRARIPAAIHVDGSARPQIVRHQHNRFHQLLEAFETYADVPVLINTSFNVAGKPIVLTSDDAVNTMLHSDLDVLVLDNLVIRRPRQPTVSRYRTAADRPLSFTPWASAQSARTSGRAPSSPQIPGVPEDGA